MKLSTAIRIGSMTTKQIKGTSTDGRNGRCAIGAAIEATGISVSQTDWAQQLRDLFPISNLYVMTSWGGTECLREVISAIWFLNDTLSISRERIADWVESIENELEAKEVKNGPKPIKRSLESVGC